MTLYAAALAFGAAALLSCSRPSTPNHRDHATAGTPSIEQALRAHTDSLMAIPGVVGVGLGECGGTPCIKVLVAKKTAELVRRIPTAIDGHPVEIQETGEFRARGT